MEAPLSVAVTERDQARGATRSPAVRLYFISVIVPVVAGLAIGAVLNRDRILDQLTTGAPYILALFIVDMFPVPVWWDIRISLGYPLIMFLAVLFQPVAVGIFVLLGAGDPREFTGKSDLLRALFNRSQVAAAAIAAAVVIHSLTPSSGLGPAMLGVAALASLVELAVNMLLVSLAARIDYGEPLKSI